MKRILAALLCASVSLSLLGGCSSKPNDSSKTSSNGSDNNAAPVELVIDLLGTDGEYPRVEEITAEVNKLMKEKINATITFNYVSQDAYSISLASLENVDLIATADYLAYFDNARKGAYMEIKQEDVEKYMPNWWANYSDIFPASNVGGKNYAIPQTTSPYNTYVYGLRKDLMDKYGIKEVTNYEQLDQYFAAVKENEGITPFALFNGYATWLNGAFGFYYSHLMAPGSPNCTSPVALNKDDDPDYQLYRTWEQPQLIEFFKIMKDFYDKGYWAADALANPVTTNDAYMAGTSGTGVLNNLPFYANSFYEQMKASHPDWELYIFDPGRSTNSPIDTFSPMAGGYAIPRASKNYESVLKAYELMTSDIDIGRLLQYGILNEDYTLNDNEEYTMVNIDVFPEGGYGLYGFLSVENRYKSTTTYPEFDALSEEVNSRLQQNPFVTFTVDTSNMQDIVANLQAVQSEYGTPLYMGMVDDVDEAIATINQKLLDAGLEAYEDEVYKQLQQFIEDNHLTQTVKPVQK